MLGLLKANHVQVEAAPKTIDKLWLFFDIVEVKNAGVFAVYNA
jgi:hypothetical protein